MKRINAYTLMEVTVALLLSAICISVCYSAFGIIERYYRTFRVKQELSDNLLILKHCLDHDFSKPGYVLLEDDGLELRGDDSSVFYWFEEKVILRELPHVHTDTFKVNYSDLRFSFENSEIKVPDTIDRLEFTVALDKDSKASVRIDKKYSAENLFH